MIVRRRRVVVFLAANGMAWAATATWAPTAVTATQAAAYGTVELRRGWAPAPFVVHVDWTFDHPLAEGTGGGWWLWWPGGATPLIDEPGAVGCKIFD